MSKLSKLQKLSGANVEAKVTGDTKAASGSRRTIEKKNIPEKELKDIVQEKKIEKESTSFSLPKNLKKTISTYANLREISASEIIEKLIEDWIEKNNINEEIQRLLEEKMKEYQ